MIRRPSRSTRTAPPCPYTTLFGSSPGSTSTTRRRPARTASSGSGPRGFRPLDIGRHTGRNAGPRERARSGPRKARMTATLPTHRIYAIRYATQPQRREGETYLGGDHEKWIPGLDFFMWAIEGGGRTIVVDTEIGRAHV